VGKPVFIDKNLSLSIPGNGATLYARVYYQMCSECGASIVGGDPQSAQRHEEWHERNDTDTETYKSLLREVRDFMKRIPRMT
jgi:hypothetical protein